MTKVREKVEKFLTETEPARRNSEKCRDYKDHKQWTAKEIATLTGRYQAPIVVNRVKPKVDGLVGLYNMRKSDPKAYPRTQAHAQASEVITDGLRYVGDNNNFDMTRLEIADEFFVEGYSGAMVGVRQKKNGEIEIDVEHVPWDRIYFDYHSRKKDFSDARWKGVMLWMDVEEAKEKVPGKAKIIDQLANTKEDGDTFEDRPRWVDSKESRIRLALHYEIVKGVWHMSISCGDTFLVEPQESPFLDDEGEPTCNIELVSAHVARDNARYGEVLGFIDQQDEINHRRSKFLHHLNSQRTYGRKGAISDVLGFKREMSKPNAHWEHEGEAFGKDFGFLPSEGAEIGQFNLYQDAKAELDAVSLNAQLAGERQSGELSGVAIGKLQQAGTIELNSQYATLADFEKRVYRQIFARMKHHWTEEKWVRVTDDQSNLRWVGFNTPITMQEALEEKINDEAEPYHVRRHAATIYTQMIQVEDPRLQETVEVRNKLPDLDMDIILDQSFDTINADEEQFRMLAQFAGGSDIDFLDLIEVSQLRGKDELIEKIQKRRAEAAQAAGGAQQTAAAHAAAKTENLQADTANKFTQAKQRTVETELMINQPDRIDSISV